MRIRSLLAATAVGVASLSAVVPAMADSDAAARRQVATTTTIATSTPSAGVVVVKAAVTSVDGTPAGTFFLTDFRPESDSSTDLGSKPAVDGKATFTVDDQTPGLHNYELRFRPDDFSAYDQSGAGKRVRILTTAVITESFAAQSPVGKSTPGTVTVDLRGYTEAPTGVVAIRDGDRTLDRGTLNKAGKVALDIPVLKDGRYRLTVVWAGDVRGERTTRVFAFVQR